MISNLPTGTMGTAYSAPAQASGGTAPYMWSIASGTLPSGLSLSAATGMITGMPTAVGTSTFALQVTDSASTPGSATASLSITIQAAALAVNTTSLPAGTAGVAYSTTLTATGGVTPYSWSVLTGNLPLGLSLSTAGVISGAPTTTGTSTFTVRVGDAESAPLTATAQLSITVNTVNIATQSLPAGTVNVSYSTTLAAVGGVTPYAWNLSGTLPGGLTLSSAGVISGTPTATGTSTFTVQVADSETPPATASAQLTLTINGGGDTGLLNGHYTWFLGGFSASSQ